MSAKVAIGVGVVVALIGGIALASGKKSSVDGGAPTVTDHAVVIGDWRATLSWIEHEAKALGHTRASDAAAVIGSIAERFGATRPTARVVVVANKKTVFDQELQAVMGSAAGMSWGDALDLAQRDMAIREKNARQP